MTRGFGMNALPRPNAEWHKYARGQAAVFSGGRHATGASRLAAMAAQRAGAGAVTILGQPDALDIHAAHVTSIMLRACGPDDAYDRLKDLKGCRACVLGPGFGDLSTARLIAVSLLTEKPTRRECGWCSMPTGSRPLPMIARRCSMRPKRPADPIMVLTPHEGEFGRMFRIWPNTETLSKLDKAIKRPAKRANAVVLYKGPDTVIAAPDGRAVINSNATPALATAGSGDVLAGLIAACWRRECLSSRQACAAAWLHGEAGRAAGPLAVAEDIVAGIAAGADAAGGLTSVSPGLRRVSGNPAPRGALGSCPHG
jgi:hydroxyethylthiazole kinase-like uncharacterized protein yjeF